MNKFWCTALLIFSVAIVSCNNKKTKQKIVRPQPTIEKRQLIKYSLLVGKDSINAFLKSTDSITKNITAAVNRADANALANFDTIVLPVDVKQTNQQYFPFAFNVPFLAEVDKIIYFSYPTQTFAAYEYGNLVYTGPTNMGRKADTTPTGLFYTNWKAEQTTSTFNDEWDLKWNFNIENKLGVGFHQYAMPGYPASHSCLRLYEKDAKFLYNWANQWKLEGVDKIITHGTPVIVFGAYPFGAARPWLALAQNGEALSISAANVENITKPFLPDILQKQVERDSVQ